VNLTAIRDEVVKHCRYGPDRLRRAPCRGRRRRTRARRSDDAPGAPPLPHPRRAGICRLVRCNANAPDGGVGRKQEVRGEGEGKPLGVALDTRGKTSARSHSLVEPQLDVSRERVTEDVRSYRGETPERNSSPSARRARRAARYAQTRKLVCSICGAARKTALAPERPRSRGRGPAA